MKLQPFNDYLHKSREFNFLLEQLEQEGNHLVYGLTGSPKSLIAALLFQRTRCPLLYLVENPQRAKEVFNDFSNLLPEQTVQFFPALDILPFEVIAQSHETGQKRLEVLQSLALGKKPIVITTIDALGKTLMDPQKFRQRIIKLKIGQRVQVDQLLTNLSEIGYQRVDMVEDRGQMSLRGGILDIYSATGENPYRLEFFDDEIDSIRYFAIENQRSIEKVDSIVLPPASEFFFIKEEREKAVKGIKEEADQLMKSLAKSGSREAYEASSARVREVTENISQGLFFPGQEQFMYYFNKDQISLLDYYDEEPLLIVDEPNRQRESYQGREKENQESYKALLERGRILPGQINNYFTMDKLWQRFARQKIVYFSLLPKKPLLSENINVLGVTAKSPNLFMGKTRLLADELKEWHRQKYAVAILVNSHDRAERLRQGLWDYGLEAVLVDSDAELVPECLYIIEGSLTAGFELVTGKLAVLTEHELFFQPKKRPPRRLFQEGKRATVLEDLKIGDYVVHTNHGIGRYLGIEKLTVGEAERDYLVIKYQGEDKVYVPTDQSGLLQKYVGQEGQNPKLSKLGGNEWNKAKSKVKAAVQDLAEELLAMYATRQTLTGHAYSPDSPWQMEFEESFPFEETQDQLKAIGEVKRDMEKPRPMDRLLCGDVGYGKTEVAIRAAFKAVSDGKQVAVLVPTTVLAQQHYTTFRERFEGFAVNVAVLSRFRTTKEQKATLQAAAQGQVDIVIGTHRLLSKDIKFKDLGLLIVDEEQRFGVVHKEKLKKLRQTVDVLTLTATPIPRTLHMSLVGVRDMSVIETPPEERYPVQTYVVEASPQLLRDAIRRELGRGGQVYYVHNRVESIDKAAHQVQELVPEARIGVAHGKMSEYQLENVMLDFMEGKLDVLVCTTIIETGLDISNVNTLIIDDADKLGLSQLYQLRGRVGRSNRVAYAYLTYNKDKVLSEVAEKRLNAIREFTELGSGFKIAMRDLEIRGAGNLLGAEQHGHVAAVGFDLYCRMLEEAVREAKGEEKPQETDVTIDLQVKAFIPQEYIHDTGVKIDFYQRIYAAKDRIELEKIQEELEDRFGQLPLALVNLLKIASIKVIATSLKVQGITQEKDQIKIKMEKDYQLKGAQLMEVARKFRRQLSFNTSGNLEIIINIRNLDRGEVLNFLEEIILEISTIAQQEQVLI